MAQKHNLEDKKRQRKIHSDYFFTFFLSRVGLGLLSWVFYQNSQIDLHVVLLNGHAVLVESRLGTFIQVVSLTHCLIFENSRKEALTIKLTTMYLFLSVSLLFLAAWTLFIGQSPRPSSCRGALVLKYFRHLLGTQEHSVQHTQESPLQNILSLLAEVFYHVSILCSEIVFKSFAVNSNLVLQNLVWV